MHKHLSEEELIELLYGLGPESSAVESCPACRERWHGVLERRKAYLESLPSAPETLLAEQRQAIYRRIESGRPLGWIPRPAAALATVGLILLGVVLSLPAPQRQPTLALTDSQFFTEVYALVESVEPQAAGPIHALFEEQP